jgi:hypothetical protein
VPNLTSPALSLAAAITWGAADFSGGVATKSANAFNVVVAAHVTGLVFMLSLALLFGEALPGWPTLLWGAVAGLIGGIGLAAFYKSLAVGTMGINAPLSAVITALVPLLFSFRTEGLPHAIQIAGFALALMSIWIIASPHGTGDKTKGLALAIVAGIGFGGFLLCMKLAGSRSVFWPLVSARTASTRDSTARLAAIRAGGSIAVVGDDDQSLYRFRGATVDLFQEFPRRLRSELGVRPQKLKKCFPPVGQQSSMRHYALHALPLAIRRRSAA